MCRMGLNSDTKSGTGEIFEIALMPRNLCDFNIDINKEIEVEVYTVENLKKFQRLRIILVCLCCLRYG